MKKIKTITVVLFLVILIIPIITFNWEKILSLKLTIES